MIPAAVTSAKVNVVAPHASLTVGAVKFGVAGQSIVALGTCSTNRWRCNISYSNYL
jgi:hypothetical protein